jgi:phage tail sheath protein FI
MLVSFASAQEGTAPFRLPKGEETPVFDRDVGGFGLGILLGLPTGISVAYRPDTGRVYADAALAWSFDRGTLHVHGDVLLRWFESFQQREPENRSYGAVYYPWLKRGDETLPPSGSMMGVFARTELERAPFGVAWPPANVPVLGVTHTEVDMDWGEAGQVSDAGVNPIVVQPGRGVVVWGARTMSKDPAWTFINSRRIVSMISEQLRRDNEWAVFEVNDNSLWKVIERDVLVRLEQFWEAGLISGTRSRAEYSVECNEGTNPLESRDSGMLNVQVALRPVGTMERILIDLRLGTGGP